MRLNCIVIDDEPQAADVVAGYIEKTPFLNLIGSYSNAVTGMKAIRENAVDLIYLDINMPELSGMEFAKILPPKIKVIFTTSYSQYAVDGYKVGAIDYLLKPISYQDFLIASNKALEWFSAFTMKHDSPERFIFVKSEYKLVKVDFDDILFIEGVKDYVKIYLENGKSPVMSLMNMKKIEECLPKPEFMRTHRSYIVHMPKITLVDRFRIVFGNFFIPISDSYKASVQKYLENHTLS